MRRRVVAAAGALAMLFIASVAGRGALVNDPPPEPSTAMIAYADRAERDVQISVWNNALLADSSSAIALGQLAALHLQRAREGGAWSDYLRAEEYARRSVALRAHRNGSTAATLANTLFAQHRFAEAQFVAAQLVRKEPDVAQYKALLGEISMELGDYDRAARLFDSLWARRTHLSIAARLARWAELNGNVKLAERLLDSARVVAAVRRDVPTETKAWYELRAGDLAYRTGKPRAAKAHYKAGLAIEPNDPRLFAAMAHLAANTGHPKDAIAWGNRAIMVQLDPEMLGVVGLAHAQLGDSAKAQEYFDAMDRSVSQQSGPFHRAWSLLLLDRGVHVEQTLERARREYAERKDIYGADLLAWALHVAGRDAEARFYMKEALRFGTIDPSLRRHANAIMKGVEGE